MNPKTKKNTCSFIIKGMSVCTYWNTCGNVDYNKSVFVKLKSSLLITSYGIYSS